MSEQTLLQQVVEAYSEKGYEIHAPPEPQDLPPFLQDAGVDAIARKGKDLILIQVKLPEDGNEHVSMFLMHNPDERYAQGLLREVEKLLSADTKRAALLMTWAAAEAALRAIAQRHEIDLHHLPPRQMILELHRRNLISDEERSTLLSSLPQRNATAHGIDAGDVNLESITALVNLTRRLTATNATRVPERGLFSTITGGNRQQLEEIRGLVEGATTVLEEVIGNPPGIVAATWERAEDSLGRSIITLRLNDFVGQVTATFEPNEFRQANHLRLRLHRLWGDLLQIRTEKKRQDLIG
jgi:hypothetical protein